MYFYKILLFSLITSFISEGYSQANKELIKSRYKQSPNYGVPNGIWLYGNTYIDETEICNIHFLEYEFHARNDSSEEFSLSQAPFMDSLNWRQHSVPPMDSSYDAYLEHYYRYPGFRYFPAVGISYDQAVNYSKWRSDFVSTFKNEALIKKGSDQRIYMHFRLPTNDEWEWGAAGLLDKKKYSYGLIDSLQSFSKSTYASLYYPRETKKNSLVSYRRYKRKLLASDSSIVLSKKEYKDQYRKLPKIVEGAPSYEEFQSVKRPSFTCRYKIPIAPHSLKLVQDEADFLTFIYDGSPNQFGIYHMIGNIAEMISEPGISKGGSWIHSPEECKISNRIPYQCPNEWLGFRNVCDVYEYHKDSVPAVVHQLQNKWSNCPMVKNREAYYIQEKKNKDTIYQKEQLLNYFKSYAAPSYSILEFIDSLPSMDKIADTYSYGSLTKSTEENDGNYRPSSVAFTAKTVDSSFHISKIIIYTISWNKRIRSTVSFSSGLEPYYFSDFWDKSNVHGFLIEVKGEKEGKEINEYFYRMAE